MTASELSFCLGFLRGLSESEMSDASSISELSDSSTDLRLDTRLLSRLAWSRLTSLASHCLSFRAGNWNGGDLGLLSIDKGLLVVSTSSSAFPTRRPRL